LAITKEYEKDGDGAESSSIVQNSIQRVEQLTEEIVESARAVGLLIGSSLNPLRNLDAPEVSGGSWKVWNPLLWNHWER
jgi:hypothetical protein